MVEYKYDAWGKCKVFNADGTENARESFIGNVNPIRYRGYYYDVETKLYYLQSRYYDPEIGRFISPDSAEYLNIGSFVGMNLYAYCGNNPVMNVDFDGHEVEGIRRLLTLVEQTLTGISQLCNYLVKHTGDVSWKSFHKSHPHVPHREYIRRNSAATTATDKLGNTLGKIALAISLAVLFIDIGLAWYNNYKNGDADWVSDSIVDTVYKGARFAIGYGITELCSMIPVPVLGTLIGVFCAFAIDLLIQLLFEGFGWLDAIKDGLSSSKGANKSTLKMLLC